MKGGVNMKLQIELPIIEKLTCDDCPFHDWEWDICSALSFIKKKYDMNDPEVCLFDVPTGGIRKNCPFVIIGKGV